MYKTFVTLLALIYASASFAQTSKQPDSVNVESKIFSTVEEEASYPGGMTAWVAFLQKSLDADVPIKNDAPIGQYTALVRFIVSKDGTVTNVRAETKLGYGMEDEVIRVVEHSGKWVPALQNGRPVNAYRRQPITFICESEEFAISSKTPYTLFTNSDNEITITARKIKPEAIAINVQGGKATKTADGKFNVRVTKKGRVNIEVVNSSKNDKLIGVASFEVVAQ